MFGNSRRLWKVLAMPSRAIRCGACPAIDRPANRTSPELGWYTPVITLNTVVLPAPLGPMRLTISRSSTSRSSSASAWSPPKCSERRSRFKMGLADSGRISGTALIAGPRSLRDLDPARPEETLGPGVHHHDQDRTEHDLPGNRGLGRQRGLPDHRRQVEGRNQQYCPPGLLDLH